MWWFLETSHKIVLVVNGVQIGRNGGDGLNCIRKVIAIPDGRIKVAVARHMLINL